jgi:hypothetical protein
MNRAETRDHGSATVAAITLCTVMLTGALLWQSAVADRALHDRVDASAIAFQAARAGAQEIDEQSARGGVITLDPLRARSAAVASAQRLLSANGDTGTVNAIQVVDRRVTVSVTITTTGRPATATATALARVGTDVPDR